MLKLVDFIIGLTDFLFPIEPDSNEALRRHLLAGNDLSSFRPYGNNN